MNTDFVLKMALLVLAIAAPILLTLLTRGGLKALGAVKDKVAAETKVGLAQDAIFRLIHIAEAVVADIETTIKPAVVEALADKELSKEEGEKLKKLALGRIKTILTEQGKQELLDLLGIASGAFDMYLGGVVEKAVVKVKAEEAQVDAIKAVGEKAPAVLVPTTPLSAT